MKQSNWPQVSLSARARSDTNWNHDGVQAKVLVRHGLTERVPQDWRFEIYSWYEHQNVSLPGRGSSNTTLGLLFSSLNRYDPHAQQLKTLHIIKRVTQFHPKSPRIRFIHQSILPFHNSRRSDHTFESCKSCLLSHAELLAMQPTLVVWLLGFANLRSPVSQWQQHSQSALPLLSRTIIAQYFQLEIYVTKIRLLSGSTQ